MGGGAREERRGGRVVDGVGVVGVVGGRAFCAVLSCVRMTEFLPRLGKN